jgi:rhodanese-related sulfurtransferase
LFGRHKIQHATPAEVAERLRDGAVLLDVRGDDEWAAGHAPKARHVPLSRVSTAAGDLRGHEVLTVCRGGGRSARAAKALAEAGVEVRNVAGGMSSWASAGLPVVRDDGSPGTVV